MLSGKFYGECLFVVFFLVCDMRYTIFFLTLRNVGKNILYFWGAIFLMCLSDLAQVSTVSMGYFGSSFWHFRGQNCPEPLCISDPAKK